MPRRWPARNTAMSAATSKSASRIWPRRRPPPIRARRWPPMSADFLVPNLAVLGALMVICALSPSRGNLARTAFAAIAAAAALRYQWWRWTDTLPQGWWSNGAGLYAFGCFVFEAVVLLDTL